MTYLARVLDSEGVRWWEGMVPDKMIVLRMSALSPSFMRDMLSETLDPTAEVSTHEIQATLERELGPEDGGPLLIYRIGAKDVLVNNG